MAKKLVFLSIVFINIIIFSPQPFGKAVTTFNDRKDNATKINIALSGSLQNPAFSPGGKYLVFTRFRNGYNKEPADLFIVDIETGKTRTLVSNDWGNINLPGSTWNKATNKIVFASTRDPHDEIYIIDSNGTPGTERQITSRKDYMAYEPSLSPNGEWVVFESHLLDVEGNGIIYKFPVAGTKPYLPLTGSLDDCRQPNWAPVGSRILYQKFDNGQWDIYVMGTDGNNTEKLTRGYGNKTDGSFSPDGKNIIYSSDEGSESYANLYSIPVIGGQSKKMTNYHYGYDGAPSWSPDGTKIAFESCQGDPDEGEGTSLWIIELKSTTIALNRNSLNFGTVAGSVTPISQTFTVLTLGADAVIWEVSEDVSWLECLPGSGSGGGTVTVSVNPRDLTTGQYRGIISVSSSSTSESPETINVTLIVYTHNQTSTPFGTFETPVDNSTVMSSIPVTGWVLDDIGLESVKIYRKESNNLVFIGDTVFVEGARPDVEQAYPGYPMNYQAGWGYMMLTNFLPGMSGSVQKGTFELHAIATDIEGHSVTLGTKTIHVDNASAVKPFGAIDTPAQGGTASGNNFVNWGWVLTPQPDSIPTDGSTIIVWVDGVNLGNPHYNLYRSDIASKFPGYANSNGAVGYFYLDTTAYQNGVHTIQWTATDTGGDTDGIGSRYFTIQNTGSDASLSKVRSQKSEDIKDLSRIDQDTTETVLIQKGFRGYGFEELITPDENRIRIRELEPVRIKLTNGSKITSCYLMIGNRIRKMPVGMSIKDNEISWMPGVGYLGNYRFVVVAKNKNGYLSKKYFNVTIEPKFAVLK
jgi:hypothetical protein